MKGEMLTLLSQKIIFHVSDESFMTLPISSLICKRRLNEKFDKKIRKSGVRKAFYRPLHCERNLNLFQCRLLPSADIFSVVFYNRACFLVFRTSEIYLITQCI